MPKRSDTRITKMRVDAMSFGQVLWDADIPGFGVEANRNSKSYKFKYYFPKNKQRMLTIGTHGALTVEAARKIALGFRAQLSIGCDPAEKISGAPVTIDSLCERYMLEHAQVSKKASSSSADGRNIKNHIRPLLGTLVAAAVTSNDIEKFKSDIRSGKSAPVDRGKVQKNQKGGLPASGGAGAANRCLSLLSKMFNLAEIWGLRAKGSNPVKGVTRYKENPKERYLSSAELKALMDHLDKLNDDGTQGMQYAVALIRLLIWTGARCGEIKSLKWSMVDWENGRLNLPDSKTGKKTIQLNEPAIALLRALPPVSNNPYVIVGDGEKKHLVNIQKRWTKIRAAVGLYDVRIHDLRHTYASEALKANLNITVIGKLMGHKSIATTQRYAHLSSEQLSAANDLYGRHITETIAGMPTASKKKNDL